MEVMTDMVKRQYSVLERCQVFKRGMSCCLLYCLSVVLSVCLSVCLSVYRALQ